ncbi:MAG: hypothetical protein ACKORD_09700, partial [Acidimicrobiaceae bacterium]
DGWAFAEKLATEGGALVSPGDFYGAGSALVEHVTSRARALGHKRIFLYTEHAQNWYLGKGWTKVRNTVFLGLHHTVMQLELVD